MSEAQQETRIPRGALIVVAVGIFACIAAALLSDSNASSVAALEWETTQPMPDSKPAQVPGGGGTMQLVDAGFKATGKSEGGYQLYRVSGVLSIEKGAPVGNGRAICKIRVPTRTIVAHTPSNRGSYPRPSEEEELIKQEVPENVVVEFNSHGTDAALVELGDAFHEYATESGITVSWSPFRVGRQGWQWGLPAGKPAKQLDLGFASIWRTTTKPAAHLACSLTTGAGSASVRTAGAITGAPRTLAE